MPPPAALLFKKGLALIGTRSKISCSFFEPAETAVLGGSNGGISLIIALIVILLLFLPGLSLTRTARQGDDLMESAQGDLARIQDYYLEQTINDVKDLQEFANKEYHALEIAVDPRMLIDEKIFYGT